MSIENELSDILSKDFEFKLWATSIAVMSASIAVTEDSIVTTAIARVDFAHFIPPA